MKIAILLSGSPRFCADFDSFISNITGFDQADYYCLFWSNNPRPDKLGYPNHVLVSESWRTINKDWAIEKIKNNLPEKQNLTKFETYDSFNIEYPNVVREMIDQFINFKNICKMYLGWKLVLDLVDQDYDLIVRARPDIMLTGLLDLRECKKRIDTQPNLILNSNSSYFGHQAQTNDLIGIGNRKSLEIYTDLINHVEKYSNERRITFHAENLLGYHLKVNGIQWAPFVNLNLRPKLIPNSDGTLSPDFGRWS